MKLHAGEFSVYPSVASTQDIARERLEIGEYPLVVFSHHQEAGRGRFGREWISTFGDSLTMSVIFLEYADCPTPWLIGMSTAVAVAGAIRAQIQWPNDLVIGGKKVGGILTEMVEVEGRKVPVVGIGVNLNQVLLPAEIAERATSLRMAFGHEWDAEELGREVLRRLADAPEPTGWGGLEPAWRLFDATPGKRFKMANGEVGTAIGVGPDGQLLVSVDGETTSVMAAEALFGPDTLT